MNNTFLLFYSPKPESQVWSLIYRKWSIDCLRKYCKNTVKYWVPAVFSRGEVKMSAIDGFHSDVIKLLSQNSELLRILIYTRLKMNKK